MRVLVSGATGFVGRAIVRALERDEHRVVALGRERKAEIGEVDAVVNLAGEPIAGRWSEEKKRAIHDSRVEGTRAIVAAIERSSSRPRVLVSASAVGIYGETFDPVDESASLGSDFLAEVCKAWELEAAAAEAHGVRVVRARLGLVLGAQGGVLAKSLPLFRAGLGGPLGSGRQWWSWIHLDDVVGMVLRALVDERWHGPVNFVSEEPVEQRTFAKVLGKLLGRPSFVPTPAFALRVAFGEGADPLLHGQRVLPRRAVELGWRFVQPGIEGALIEAISPQSETQGAGPRRREAG